MRLAAILFTLASLFLLDAGCRRARSDALGTTPSTRATVRPAAVRPGEPLGAVFACYDLAEARTLLEDPSVATLCEGASDATPVLCYLEARDETFLSQGDAIALCRCATSLDPVACYVEGHGNTALSSDRILDLCSPVTRLDLEPDCTLRELGR